MDMIRPIHPATLAAFSSEGFFPAAMIYLDWPGDPVRVHSGKGVIPWGGESWLGAGNLGRPETSEDGIGKAPGTLSLRMILAEEDFEDVMAADVLGRRGKLYVAAVTARSGNELIGEPVEMFSGAIAKMGEVLEKVDDRTLASAVRLGLRAAGRWRAKATTVHSDEDQRATYPEDTIGRLLINSPDRARRILV